MNSIHKYILRLRQNPFVRASIVLVGGTVFAQAISVLVLPIVTRVYAPSDFQSLAVYSATVQLVSVVAGLRLENAIPLPESEDESVNLVAVSLLSAALFAGLAALILMVFKDPIGRLTAHALSTDHLSLVPVGIFSAAAYGSLQAWVVRDKNFPLIARTKVAQSLASVTSQLGIGALHHGPLGLLVGYVLQTGAGCFSLARYAVSRRRDAISSISRTTLARSIAKYQDFPKYDMVGTLAQAAGLQLPLIYIATLPIGPEVGFLSLGIRVMQIPVTMISAAVAQIYLSSAPEALRQGTLSTLTARTVGGLAKAAIGPMLALAVVSPVGFRLLFGADWARSGTLMRWLAPLFVVHMLSGAVGTSLYVTGRQRVALVLNVFGLVVRLGAVYAASRFNAEMVSECYAISGTAVYVVYLITSLRSARVEPTVLWSEAKGALPITFAWIVGAYGCKLLLSYLVF